MPMSVRMKRPQTTSRSIAIAISNTTSGKRLRSDSPPEVCPPCRRASFRFAFDARSAGLKPKVIGMSNALASCKRQCMPVQMDSSGGRDPRFKQALQSLDAHIRNQDSGRCACECEHHVLCQQLLNNSAPPSSQCCPRCKFDSAAESTRQEKVRNVRATDQEDKDRWPNPECKNQSDPLLLLAIVADYAHSQLAS